MTIWLYHINPKNSQGYTYGWDVERPSTLLKSKDKDWDAGQMLYQVKPGDLIHAYMKNIAPNPPGVYVVGTVTGVDIEDGTLHWRVDENRSAGTLTRPIGKDTVRAYFGRGYGGSMQRLPAGKTKRWLRLIGHGEVTDGIPLVKARTKPRPMADTDPIVSRENGLKGERHVMSILKKRYPKSEGFQVTHVSQGDAGSDHDIGVKRRGKRVRLVEVKTRVGRPPQPVIISERELLCRKENSSAHSIFVVYLGLKGSIRNVVEIDSKNAFALKPRQHWLTPGINQ
jgi:hypothetical protein